MSLADDDARPIRKGSLAKPTQFGYTAQVTDNRKGVVVDYEIAAGMPPDAPRLVPAIERAIAAVGGRARRRHRRSGLWRIVGR